MIFFNCSLILVGLEVAVKPVTITTEQYKIWRGSYRISNGIVDLVVVPQVGRIMRFAEVGKPNLLWEGDQEQARATKPGGWANWGGDKVWPAPQDLWGWPPEREYDGVAWTVKPIRNGVRMTSKTPTAKLGVRFERTILLNNSSTSVEITNTLINDSIKSQRLSVWEVCQVDDPKECILPVWKSKNHPNGWSVYHGDKVDGLVRELGHELHVTRDLKRGLKYGSGSPTGEITAIVGNYSITMGSPFDIEKDYPDGGNAQQLYTSANPNRYAELELVGPLTTLAPGKSASIRVMISLKRNETSN